MICHGRAVSEGKGSPIYMYESLRAGLLKLTLVVGVIYSTFTVDLKMTELSNSIVFAIIA